MSRIGLAAAAIMLTLFTGTSTALAQDALVLLGGARSAGTQASVPVSILDSPGTSLGGDAGVGRRIQGVALRVLYDPAQITGVSFARAGALRTLTPLYERSVSSTGSFAWVASFSEVSQPIQLTSTALPGDRIGTLLVNLAPGLANGTVVKLAFDPLTTVLSNTAGTTFESRHNRQLSLYPAQITVGGTATSTAVTSNRQPSTAGQSVTFVATVTAATASVSGSVTFYDGSTAIGSAWVFNGIASLATAALSVGSHSITAAFEGDLTRLPSTSPAITQTVQHVLDAPTGVTAAATGPTTVAVSWSAVAGATHYEVVRRSQAGGAIVLETTGATSFADSGCSPSTAYIYTVRAVNAGGASADSAPDLATTVIFSDNPIVPAVHIARASHLSELRLAVNAVRLAAGLQSTAFTDSASPGVPIRRVHIVELRSALATALSILGMPAPSFEDAVITAQSTPVKASHIQQLRNLVQ